LVSRAGLHHNPKTLSVDLMYEGSDTYADFAANGGVAWAEQLAELQRTGIADPLNVGVTIRVEVVHTHDGAARNNLSGQSSHSSTFSSPFCSMTGEQSRNLLLKRPLTRTVEQMKRAEPAAGLTDSQRQSRARLPEVAGIIGSNLLLTPMHRLLAEALHVQLRLVSTTLQNTTRTIMLAKGDLDSFVAHLRECLGIKARLVWLGDRGVEVCASGNECRLLLAAGAGVVCCRKEHRHDFLPSHRTGQQVLSALAEIWDRLAKALRMLRECDPLQARLDLPALHRDLLLLGLMSAAAFGPRAVTPTFRMAIDIAPAQQQVRCS
jgi:hypothetical protein